MQDHSSVGTFRYELEATQRGQGIEIHTADKPTTTNVPRLQISSNTNLNRSPRIHTPRTEKEHRANWNTEIENNNSKRTNTKSGNTWDGENMQNNNECVKKRTLRTV